MKNVRLPIVALAICMMSTSCKRGKPKTISIEFDHLGHASGIVNNTGSTLTNFTMRSVNGDVSISFDIIRPR